MNNKTHTNSITHKIVMMTKWHDNECVCSCPLINKCNKEHDCEEIEFSYNPYADVRGCMNHPSYKKIGGATKQLR